VAGQKTVKPDPSLWLPLLDAYRLTALPHDTVLEGTLRADLTAASPEVTRALSEWPAAAYLQREGDETRVVLVYQLKHEPRRWPWLQLALFAATIVTTLGAGALMRGLDPFSFQVVSIAGVDIPYPSRVQWRVLWLGIPFAFPFLGVLLAHEMGHYVAARVHRVRVSLPYFIPFPPYFSIIGTAGAFIRLKGPIVRRTVLFDVGSAGPFASFALSVPILALGLTLSETIPGRASVTTPFAIEFSGQLVWLGNGLVTHVLATVFGPGRPGESMILLHPLALVGWLGLFVTTLNLLPLGQLDGGHILYALEPRRHVLAARGFLLALVPLGFVWWGWWAWAVVVLVLHRGRVQHPPVILQETTIGGARGVLGWLLIVMFLVTFVPVPMNL